MTPIELFDTPNIIPLQDSIETEGPLSTPENWYAEPFTKRTACRTPGQCGGDCDCGCPYNTMTDVEQLPLIEEIARIFPNEWLAFIISPEEDDDFEPVHGKLIAHSANPDEVYDAVNTVLWNQHVYIFYNGEFDNLQASYGDAWDQTGDSVTQRTFSGPKQINQVQSLPLPPEDVLPEDLMGLLYSAIDQLYSMPNLNQAIRRLRLARVRAGQADNELLLPIIDAALDQLEVPLPRVNEVTWFLEEALAELEEKDLQLS